MQRTNPIRNFSFALALVFFGVALSAVAQAPSRFVGTVAAINGDELTVKTDAGAMQQVIVPSTAVMKRVEPGQKDLSAAVTITLADLNTGDRVLVRLDPSAPADAPQAAQIITIKQADVARKQQEEREAWQRTGVGGLVKSVDASAGSIVLTTGAGPTAKTVTVHVDSSAILKRYAPGSIRFDLAQPAPISAIQPGDQLRARGAKNADGSQLDAVEVVSGSFRNLSGTIVALDSASSSFTMKDLLSKKQVTVRVTPDAQMHTLPEMMARMLAARLKAPAAAEPAAAEHMHRQGGDLQQMLNRTPAIQFADLKKGEAVMVVATASPDNLTAVTLLAGVEPLLEAPEASRDLLSNWSMGSGGAGEAESQ
ncbi:MAG TPA: hypothetical protein VG893_10390 [Terracidiphilus sp.]|nr:hypothetical protein [Terracidiphilus sp.]